MNTGVETTGAAVFAPGDAVVYPRHGAGVVRALSEHAVGGQARQYYEVELNVGAMQLLVPVARAAALGLRRALTAADLPALYAALEEADLALPEGFQARYRREQAALEGGDVYELARLCTTLTRRQVRRGLAGSEFTLLDQAKGAVADELAGALKVPAPQALRELETRLEARPA